MDLDIGWAERERNYWELKEEGIEDYMNIL